LSTIQEGEKRWFGIGQGSLRVTPLQVANSIAIIARRGLYRTPRLFMENAGKGEHRFQLPKHFIENIGCNF